MKESRLGLLAAALATAAVLLTSGCRGDADRVVTGGPAHRPPVSTAEDLRDATLWLSFDEQDFDYDGRKTYPDARDGRFAGRVVTADQGKVESVPGPAGSGSAVAFPARCDDEPECPRALVEVPDDPALDPGDAPFEFGATVRLEPGQTTSGSNIVQKGRFAASDALWKLQVDNDLGHPSCVIRSGDDLLRVRSGVSISDGEWHRVVCRKTDDGIGIEVDGVGRDLRGRLGQMSSEWPIRIGAPGVGEHDDQFHGEIDDVYLRVGVVGD